MSEIAAAEDPGCRYANIGRQYVGRDWAMVAHAHPYHQLILVLRGAQWAQFESKAFVARAGELLLYPAGVFHAEGVTEAPLETVFLGIEWEGLGPGTPRYVRDTQGRVQQFAEWLYAEREAYFIGAPQFRDALIRAMVAEYLRLAVHREDEVVERVRAYVRQRIDANLTLDELSVCAGLSKYHFVRTYRDLTGLTPMADVRRIRIEAARQILLTTNLPLKAVAARVGLANEYHLSRLLRTHLGTGAKGLRKVMKPRRAQRDV